MANSLQDQLLRSGLATKKQSNQVKKSKKKQKRQQRAGVQSVDENKARVAEAERQQLERDRALNEQRQEAARRKALGAEIDQLIRDNQLEMEQGEVAYSFTDGNKIKQLHLGPAMRKQLAAGRVRVATLGGGYALVTAEVAERVRSRDAGRVLGDDAGNAEAEDDAYAGYEVPDDLMW